MVWKWLIFTLSNCPKWNNKRNIKITKIIFTELNWTDDEILPSIAQISSTFVEFP